MPGLFVPVDKTQRLFGRRDPQPLVTVTPPALPLTGTLPRAGAGGPRSREVISHSFGELQQLLLLQHTPPSAIISETYDVLHLSQGAGRFLQFEAGELSPNLLNLLHPALRIELRTALFSAGQAGRPAETRQVPLLLGGERQAVSLLVEPISEPSWAQGSFLVIFRAADAVAEVEPGSASDAEPIVRHLESELQRTKDQLRMTIEQYETAFEEYKAANEELQAINEELRAASEELETSKEELQSVNEELTTVNGALKYKVEELSQANNDLQNLMGATEIGTMFLDRELRIKLYTPSIQRLFNVIPADFNRPLAHITHRLAYERLPADATYVRDTLQPVEREVQSRDGRWYLARLLPNRTTSDEVDGVVLTFVEISERKRGEQALRESELRLRQIVQHLPVAVMITADDGTIVLSNPKFERAVWLPVCRRPAAGS